MNRIALSQLPGWVGKTLGTSAWVTLDQRRIDRFAEATNDHQWIHVDPARAALGPFKTTIAHGFLTLALLPELFASAYEVTGSRMGTNYGLNRVRFPAPVPAGSRLRGRFELTACEPIDGGVQLTVLATVEAEGVAKPVCVAESLTRQYV